MHRAGESGGGQNSQNGQSPMTISQAPFFLGENWIGGGDSLTDGHEKKQENPENQTKAGPPVADWAGDCDGVASR